MTRRSSGRAVAGVMGAAVLGLVLAGCGGPRNSLNTDASVCFRALAVANEAVHHKGKLVGVRRVNAEQFAEHMPPTGPGGTTAAVREPVCLVAYASDYHPGDVVDARPAGPGRYAMVAVTTGTPVLLAARVTDDLPLRFRHQA